MNLGLKTDLQISAYTELENNDSNLDAYSDITKKWYYIYDISEFIPMSSARWLAKKLIL